MQGPLLHQPLPEGHFGLDLCREISLQIPVGCNGIMQGSWPGCALLLPFQQELFGWGGPSAPLLIPTQGIMALCFPRGVGGCNPLLRERFAVGWCWNAKQCFRSEDAVLRQEAHFAGSYERSRMVHACSNACQWEFGFCAELFSSAPILCQILTLKISVLQASTFCDRDLQGSLGLLSVQLVLDFKSCFHGPSEDPWMLTQCQFTHLIVGLQLIFIFLPYFCCLHKFHKVVHIDREK